MVTLNSRVQTNEEVLFQELQGEGALFNLKTGVHFGLNPVGTRIWRLLAEHKLLADVAQTIVREYDITEERCSADLLDLVEDLERQGLVSVS